MTYSPKLKNAMEDIKSILKKYDIAAFVVLHDEVGLSEYLNYITPSYSCAKIDNEGNVVVKLKASEVGKEEAQRLADRTYNMFTHLSDVIARHAMMYMDTKIVLQEKWGGEDGPSGHTSNVEQGN